MGAIIRDGIQDLIQLNSTVRVYDDGNAYTEPRTNYTISPTAAEFDDASLAETEASSTMETIIHTYTLPVIISFGILGNLITLYIIKTTPLQNVSVCHYMSAYAVFNILSLSLNMGMDWLFDILGQKHFTHESDTVCRIWQFFIRIVTYSGVWFVIAMAVDRYITVRYQHKRKQLCTPFIAKLTIVIILTGMVCLSVHAMWTYEVVDGYCYIVPDAHDIHRRLWPWVSGMIYSSIPIALIFFIGNAICFRLGCNKQNDDKLGMDLTHATIAICCLYFMLCSPATIINVMDNTIAMKWKNDVKFMNILKICRDISLFLAWINFNIMLPVLCLCCDAFRQPFAKDLSCFKHRTLSSDCTAV